MEPSVYRVIHILSVMLLFTALGGLLLASRAGVTTGVSRKTAGMTHGLALILLLVSGFGALARIGLSNPGIWPAWLWLKFLLWLVFGGIIVLIRRAPRSTTLLWWVLPILGALAGYLAIYKP
ncbi:MAG TPA: hypothetical protein VHC97_02195 [Thermoanaerobaculia bacterium]|jgi:hypothetical protein|nr:hypothetical protein [Thermoanaerobaculia bacterium]